MECGRTSVKFALIMRRDAACGRHAAQVQGVGKLDIQEAVFLADFRANQKNCFGIVRVPVGCGQGLRRNDRKDPRVVRLICAGFWPGQLQKFAGRESLPAGSVCPFGRATDRVFSRSGRRPSPLRVRRSHGTARHRSLSRKQACLSRRLSGRKRTLPLHPPTKQI